jgi:hypothetical protein
MKSIGVFIITGCCLQATAQVGGSNSYAFLSLPPSARSLALGGNMIHTRDGNVSLGYENPATLNAEMHGGLAFNNAFYFAGTTYGYAGYARSLDKLGVIGSAGIFYVNYGSFQGSDAAGNRTQVFTAGDYALHAGFSGQYSPRIRYGLNLKLLYSHLESYTSLASAVDLGTFYEDTSRLLTAALVLKNIGLAIKPYLKSAREPLPFEVQLGVSKRLEHTPFKLMFVFHNLQQPNIRYEDPLSAEPTNLFNDTTETEKPKKYIADKIGRHIIFGTEFYLGKTLRLRVGYNHQRRAEMALQTRRAMAGFSFGTAFKINRFTIDYGYGFYHLAGKSHMIGISTKMSEFTGM